MTASNIWCGRITVTILGINLLEEFEAFQADVVLDLDLRCRFYSLAVFVLSRLLYLDGKINTIFNDI